MEVKCPYRRQIIDGYIPECYFPQVQLNLFICNLSTADFIEYCPRTNKLNIVRIIKDMNWIETNVLTLIEFWKSVVYYREQGIETNEEYIKKQKRELQKQEKLRKRELEEIDEQEQDQYLDIVKSKQCLIID